MLISQPYPRLGTNDLESHAYCSHHLSRIASRCRFRFCRGSCLGQRGRQLRRMRRFLAPVPALPRTRPDRRRTAGGEGRGVPRYPRLRGHHLLPQDYEVVQHRRHSQMSTKLARGWSPPTSLTSRCDRGCTDGLAAPSSLSRGFQLVKILNNLKMSTCSSF